MRAAFYERTGPAREVLQVGELSTPRPGPGEVRIRLATSGVNPSDVKSRAGLRSATLPFARIVPHSDGAGVIDAVGEGSVPAGRVGERVWTWNAGWKRAFGTAAQFVTLPADQAVLLPGDVPFDAGACLGIPALTALHAVRMDGGVAGKTVLVAGGAGAVGHYAVQMAKLLGARRVIATVSSEEKAALARQAGADVVLNYRSDDLVARVRAAEGSSVDRVIEVDFAANVAIDLDLVKPEGDIVVYGSGRPEIAVPFFPAIVKNLRLRFFIVYQLTPADRAAAIEQLSSWLAQGRLRHNVAARLPLDRIADAHELVESGCAPGNVVVEIADRVAAPG